MNILSALSLIICTAFLIGAWRIVAAERKSVLNLSGFAVLVSLGWWSFANAFFFAADSPIQAMSWHRLASIGWCGFVALTAYYFFALIHYGKKPVPRWKQLLFFAPTLLLICKNLFGKTTSLAQSIIPSTSGWGWTYENSATSVWLWIYLIYVALYFGYSFFLLLKWAKSVQHRMKREMAIRFIVLDTITIFFGLVTDVILPLTRPVLPALASVATALFGLGYFALIYRKDVFNINLIISPEDILQTSNNSIFVMDENQEILKCNRAVDALLGYSKEALIGAKFADLTVEPVDLQSLCRGEELIDIEARLRCKDGLVKDVLLSAKAAEDKRHQFVCSIVSCQDVSKQKKIQAELALQREKYKHLAGEYQQLAYFDPLTGLPNRRHFFDTLGEFEARYRTEQEDFAVIFLDLDNFKRANDLYGHKGGDELLVAAANKLRACAEPGEFVARLGGDEFMLVIPYKDSDCIQRKTKRIRDEFCKSIFFNGHQYEIGISAGYGLFSQIGDVGNLMQKADEAMYGDKNETFLKVVADMEARH
ncbi:MAG: diguanylate cyclase [Pseudoflavonifractor sp.]